MAQQKPKKLVSLQGELDNNKRKKNQEALSHDIRRAKENTPSVPNYLLHLLYHKDQEGSGDHCHNKN